MSPDSDQTQQRQANLAELARLGIEIYPRTFERRQTISELVDSYGPRTHDELEAERPESITSGRILAIRAFGKANFLVLSDGHAKIQVYIRQDSLPELDFKIYKLLDFGDWVGVEGRLFRTRTNELTIWASRLHFLSKCLLPLPEKWHGLADIELERARQVARSLGAAEHRVVSEHLAHRAFEPDHPPPHFHAVYAEHEAAIEIDPIRIYAGQLPTRARSFVFEWAAVHQGELMANWNALRAGRASRKISPLP
jgi:lysyl-tRNA synthetase class II